MRRPGSDDRQRVLDATDIVELVRESVALRPKGREWVGLCPFHDDHNPSMHVVPAKGIFHCFVCGAGGNAFDWLMRRHNMTFREALEQLAQRGDVELTARGAHSGDGGQSQRAGREALLKTCDLARRFYAHTLARHADAAPARALLEKRGVKPETIERFQLGCAPDRWDGLLQVAEQRGVPRETLAAAGLIKPRKDGGGHYDALRNRLIFPIHDPLGRVVAFGGRRLNDDEGDEAGPKYLNSPETLVFDKSSMMYALHPALNSVRRLDHVVVVEGYMDAIACHQAGFTNVVATMGTALTVRHARLLSRLCSTATLVFDADEPGLKAAERAIEVFFPHAIDVRIAALPPGDDPDDVLHGEDGAARLRGFFESAADGLTFRFSRLAQRLERAGPAAMSRAIEDELQRLLELGLAAQPPIRRRLVISKLAALARVSEADIAASLRRMGGSRRAARGGPAADADDAAPARPDDLERATLDLLGCLLCRPALRAELSRGDLPAAGDAATPAGSMVIQAYLAAGARDRGAGETGLSDTLDQLEDSAARALATALVARIEQEIGGDSSRLSHRAALAARARRRILLKREARAALDLAPHAPNDSGAAEPAPAPDSRAIAAAIERRRRMERECGGDPLAFPAKRPLSV